MTSTPNDAAIFAEAIEEGSKTIAAAIQSHRTDHPLQEQTFDGLTSALDGIAGAITEVAQALNNVASSIDTNAKSTHNIAAMLDLHACGRSEPEH